ncbi:Myb-like protein L [Linum grandiflorum]
MKKYLPKVDWNKLAEGNEVGHSGPECLARWINSACPLINNSGWTRREEKLLLYVIQTKGNHNWSEIASLLGTNRTPFQCLERFQRSLNACVLKKEWTKEEDAQLEAAVHKIGECDWQSVAATLRGRTGTQCSNRWLKSLHVYGKGHWKPEEDKRLKLAVKFFGPKDWKKVASFVPGRKDVQCRERWHNACSPSLNRGAWTDEEDSRLKAAVEEHGHSWSKVAHHIPGRTDNDCMRRWKVLFPREVPLLKEARKIRKVVLITNFVDREEERPALGLEDFVTTSLVGLLPDSEKVDRSGKSRRQQSNGKTTTRPKKTVEQAQNGTADVGDAESCGGNTAAGRKNTVKRRRRKKDHAEPPREPSPDCISSPLRTKENNGKVLLVYTRRKKGINLKNSHPNLSKEANSSTKKEAEAPSNCNEEVSTKGIGALRPHCNRHEEQETGHKKDSAWDNVTLSSLRTSKKRKRKLEIDNSSKITISDSEATISNSEATISAELECRETSSYMTIDSRRDPGLISIYSRKRKKIHQKHDVSRARSFDACVSDVTS